MFYEGLLQSPDFEGFPKIPRLNRDVIITEKIDGTNAQIFISEDGKSMRMGSRKRWLTRDHDNYGFRAWARDHFEELLKLGPGRHFGEWWGQGIQRNYGLDHKRFSLFNVGRWCERGQMPMAGSTFKYVPECCSIVPILRRHVPFTTVRVEECLETLLQYGSAAVPGFMKPEGIVIYHTAGNCLFKVTLENDEKPKGERQ